MSRAGYASWLFQFLDEEFSAFSSKKRGEVLPYLPVLHKKFALLVYRGYAVLKED